MSFVFPPAAAPGVPVHGDAAGALFPVRRIYCVGRNYVRHAIEMGHSGREAPFFFMKPGDAVLPVAPGTIGRMHYPTLSRSLHHELELVVAIGKGGRDIAAADALGHVWGSAGRGASRKASMNRHPSARCTAPLTARSARRPSSRSM